jgi:hypothetical protein
VEPAFPRQGSDSVPSAPQVVRPVSLHLTPAWGTRTYGLPRLSISPSATVRLTTCRPLRESVKVVDCMEYPCGWRVVTPPFTALRRLMGHAPSLFGYMNQPVDWLLAFFLIMKVILSHRFRGKTGRRAVRRADARTHISGLFVRTERRAESPSPTVLPAHRLAIGPGAPVRFTLQSGRRRARSPSSITASRYSTPVAGLPRCFIFQVPACLITVTRARHRTIDSWQVPTGRSIGPIAGAIGVHHLLFERKQETVADPPGFEPKPAGSEPAMLPSYTRDR